MKSKKLFLALLFLIGNFAQAQDIITKKNGDDIKAKVLEVNQNEIKYKSFSNPDGPLFVIYKSDVLLIRYENGTKDIFSESANNQINYNANSNSNGSTLMSTSSTSDMRTKGKQDALVNYKGKRSGAGWTCATSIVCGPLFGLIPAAACSASEPIDENLNYRDPELMKNNDYNLAYTSQAHKIKKRKVWTNYGIGSGFWIVFILLAL
jgi:hypothetical protein